jgi:uncharacterized membrane protein YphA (DoxX/SURF4 family)
VPSTLLHPSPRREQPARTLDLRAGLWLVVAWTAVLAGALAVVGDRVTSACAAVLAGAVAVAASRFPRPREASAIDWDAFDAARREWGERVGRR